MELCELFSVEVFFLNSKQHGPLCYNIFHFILIQIQFLKTSVSPVMFIIHMQNVYVISKYIGSHLILKIYTVPSQHKRRNRFAYGTLLCDHFYVMPCQRLFSQHYTLILNRTVKQSNYLSASRTPKHSSKGLIWLARNKRITSKDVDIRLMSRSLSFSYSHTQTHINHCLSSV